MKKKKNKNSKYIPTKNYIYGALILLAVVFLAWYAISWYEVKEEEKLMTSYLITTNTLSYEIKNLNEVTQVLKESPNNYFIYISYTNDENVYRLEKKIKKVIDNYELQDEFYYINITDIKDDDKLLRNLNDTFNTTKINNVPCILYYQNGDLKQIITEDKKVFSIDKLTDLLTKYEYEK